MEQADATDVQLTVFESTGQVDGAIESSALELPMHYIDTPAVEQVKLYLQRPQQLANGSWTNSSNKILYSTAQVGSPLWITHAHYPKTLGAFGIRATSCFRLEVVATPQHAGLLRMGFAPFLNGVASVSRSQLSQLAGVELTLNQSTAATFRVPYIHPRDFFHVNTTDSQLGCLFLADMAGLVAAAEAGNVAWTIYWWLEDVQLTGAMPASVGASYLNARNSILAKLQAS